MEGHADLASSKKLVTILRQAATPCLDDRRNISKLSEKKQKREVLSTSSRVHNAFTHIPDASSCKICQMTQTPRSEFKTRPSKRSDGFPAPTEFGDWIIEDSTIGIQTAKQNISTEILLVHDVVSYWTQRHLVRSKNV